MLSTKMAPSMFQMCKMTAQGYEGSGSPDRVDALVWGMTQLFPKLVSRKQEPTRSARKRPPVSGGWMAA